MTQAVNLANFANNLDSSGGVSPSALNASVPVSKGGTNATTAAAARTNLGLAIGTDIPSLTGAGASGTWPISISGNAATATNAINATNATNATNAVNATNATNATNVTNVTTSQVLNATAAATAGMVGTYAFMSYVGNTVLATDTLAAGSDLRYRSAQSYAVVQGIYISAYAGGAASGTWRLMGYVNSVYEYYGLNANNNDVSSLWLRIA